MGLCSHHDAHSECLETGAGQEWPTVGLIQSELILITGILSSLYQFIYKALFAIFGQYPACTK